MDTIHTLMISFRSKLRSRTLRTLGGVALTASGAAWPLRALAEDATPPAAPAEAATLATPPAPEAAQAPVAESGAHSWWSGLTPERVLNIGWDKLLVKPHFGSQALFTDNFNYQNGQGTNVASSDVLLTFSPGVKLQYGATDYNHFSADYTFDDVLYTRHGGFDTTQNHLAFAEDFRVGRFQATGTDTLDFLSSFVGSGNTIRNTLIERRVWVDDYTLTYDATDKLQPYVHGYHYDTEYAPSVHLYGSDNLAAYLGSSYLATQNLTLFADVQYGQTSVFTGPSSGLPNNSPHSVILGGHFGARGSFTRDLTGSVSVGYVERSFAPQVHAAAATTPTASATLSYAATDKLVVRGVFERRSDVSANFGSQTTVYQSSTLTLTQYIGSSGRWLAQVSGGLIQLEYSDVPPQKSGRDDTVYTLGATVVYQPQAWLSASLGYSFEKYSVKFNDPTYAKNSQLSSLGYQVNQVILQMRVGF